MLSSTAYLPQAEYTDHIVIAILPKAGKAISNLL
jgi:hypothetical protein